MQLAAVEALPSFLAAHPAVRLLVLDSVTFHFRQVSGRRGRSLRVRLTAHACEPPCAPTSARAHARNPPSPPRHAPPPPPHTHTQDYADMAQRTRQLAGMAQALMAVAGERDVAVSRTACACMRVCAVLCVLGSVAIGAQPRLGASARPPTLEHPPSNPPTHTHAHPPTHPSLAQVVLMNQVTTRLAGGGGGGGGGAAAAAPRLVPALGDTWAHAATSRVILHWRGGARHAFLYKSPSQPAASAEYTVTKDGVRGRRAPKRPRSGAAADPPP